jgi:hypothetical protein
MLDPDPQRRPSAKELLLHPLLVTSQQNHLKAKLETMKQKIIGLKRKLKEIENSSTQTKTELDTTTTTTTTTTPTTSTTTNTLLQRRVSAPNLFHLKSTRFKVLCHHNGDTNHSSNTNPSTKFDSFSSPVHENSNESFERESKRQCTSGDHSCTQNTYTKDHSNS